MAVKRIEAVIVFLPLIAVLVVTGWVIGSTYLDNETKNAPARAAGFVDAAEMNKAKDAGFAVPKDWRAEVDRRAPAERDARAQADVIAAQNKAAAAAVAAKDKADEENRKQSEKRAISVSC